MSLKLLKYYPKPQKKKIIDPCPICRKELHLDEKYTQRVGLLGDFDEVIGWMCPHCSGMFDTDNNLTGIQGLDEMGEA